MVEFIKSESFQKSKVILWRLGNYSYQVEVLKWGTHAPLQIDINAEFDDALEQFDQVVKNHELY